ncbi:MAG: FkbM family methyltransferase [Steroidobacteraceae bacterium]
MSDPIDRADEGDLLLRLVDVGSSGGLQEKWLPHLGKLQPVLFDVNADEARKLRAKYPNSIVVEEGLSDQDGPQRLFITVNHKCISLLEPNFEVLEPYATAHAFKLRATSEVICSRYLTLHNKGIVPQPDFIKIDVQGWEYQVLVGFGELLQDCLSIELESHFYPIYKGQRLLHDIIGLLAGFGFVLRRLDTSPNFAGDMIEVDAFFTKSRVALQRAPPIQQAKYALIRSVQHFSY